MLKKNSETERLNHLFGDTDPILEENVRARMIIAAEIDDEIKARGWSIQELHKACNAVIPSDESNYGPGRIENWLSGTHDFKISEIIILRKVLGKTWLNRINKRI